MNSRVLEYYSVVTAHTVDTSLYIKRLAAAELEQDDLIDVLAWQCAANVLQVMGKEQSALATKKVDEFIMINSI